MFITPKNRYHAFVIHILISALIFMILATVITYFWYPGFLFATDGGWDGIRLIAGIDFIIGPTLTLIIYKVGKRHLKLDLFVIGLIQFSCLYFGVWTVYQERPIAVIYANGVFLAKSQAALEMYNIKPAQIYELDTKVPAWIYINLPENEDEKSKVLISQLHKGPLYTHTELYAPYKENLDKVFNGAIDPDKLGAEIEPVNEDNRKLYPYSARYGTGYIEIDGTTGEFLKIH
tara:strand:+ start:2425 stop:3120 length:696 start_codon:yes stop_codon:yes gene_type:complete